MLFCFTDFCSSLNDKEPDSHLEPSGFLYTLMNLRLLVYLELRITVLEEGVDLLGSSDAGVDVGLGCLSTHLLRCREVTSLELQELVVSIGHDVSNELQVLTLSHQLDEAGLVDNFLTGSVYEDVSLNGSPTVSPTTVAL